MEPNQQLPDQTPYARRLEWYPLASIKAIAKSSMEERKALFFLNALERVAAMHTKVNGDKSNKNLGKWG